MEWPPYYFTHEPFKTSEEMARIDSDYAAAPSISDDTGNPSSSYSHDRFNSTTLVTHEGDHLSGASLPSVSSNIFYANPQARGWKYGGCLTQHLEFFQKSCTSQGFFNPATTHCLFTEQRPSPLLPTHPPNLLLFCSCTTCHRMLSLLVLVLPLSGPSITPGTPAALSKITKEIQLEIEAWEATKARWRQRKEQGWKVLRRKRMEAAVVRVELEGVRARRVVAEALGLASEEVEEWERKGERRWREQAVEEAVTRDYILKEEDGEDGEGEAEGY